jgi:protein-tyrosine-phosphatase/predicted ATP-grasp superfamily ATP-dependent carboligase
MRVLVTDAHELSGLGAIRSLGRAGHHVIAGYPARMQRPASTYSRYRSAQRTYPDPWLTQPEFRGWLLANAAAVDLVLPCTEAALVAAASCRSQLPNSVAIVAPSAAALNYTLSKRRATARALTLGIPCPRTAFSLEEASGMQAPCIVRTDNRLMADGSYHKGRNWYVENSSELMDLLGELNDQGEQWIVQENIVGKGAAGFLLMWRGRPVLEFAHERIHEVPFYGGVSSLRKSVRDAELIATTAKLLASIGYEGAAMVEFRRSRLNGVAYFVEINGRLWGSLALALHAGVDFPAKLVDCHAAVSTPATPADYAAGIYCRNVYPLEVNYLRTVLTAHGPLRGVYPPPKMKVMLEFFGLFFTPRMHYDHFWLRDPLPWIWQSIHDCDHVIRTLWNRWQSAARRRRQVRKFARRGLTVVPDLREVLFLCYGNICRSAFAGAYWNQNNGSSAAAKSAGFYPQGERRTPARISRLAKELGVDLAAHRSRAVDPEAIEHATAIFVMDGQNLDDLLTVYPQAQAKAWLLGSFRGVRAIHDPYLLPEAQASESLRQVKESIDVILERYAGSANALQSRAEKGSL